MSDTPRTDAQVGEHSTFLGHEFVSSAFARQLERELAAANAVLRKIRDGSEDGKVCCGTPIVCGGNSFDEPPYQECCGHPEMLHDILDAAIAKAT